ALTATYSILYIIDALGFKNAATITAISLFVVLLTDYPSGSLGDWVGQKTVLLIALLSFSASFLVMSYATSFNDFVLVAILLGIGQAQASGALQSWLDNTYKLIDPSLDPDRKNYGYSMTKIQALASLVSGISFIIGGYLAFYYSRPVAFRFQSALIFITGILVLKLLSKPTSEVIIINENLGETNGNSFFDFLKGGIQFFLSSKTAFFFILGISVLQVIWTIWGGLMLFPFYFAYTGSDASAGILRSLIFFAGVFIQIKMSSLTKKVDNDKLVTFILVQGITLFIGGILILYYIPHDNTLSWLGVTLVFLLMGISVSLTMPFINALMQRVMVDLVPSENRNAVYSLVPTIQSAIAIPLLPLIGGLIETSGLITGFASLLIVLFSASLLIWLAGNFQDSKFNAQTRTQSAQPVIGD
ncbi:MAG: MFS transporter, partial [Candidatus Kariarchaeaceae archaeon]